MPDQFVELRDLGFDVTVCRHADAILSVAFPDVAQELTSALRKGTIPIEEIIAGGGGEAKGTQRLRGELTRLGWPKTPFSVERTINGVAKESKTHIVDHVRTHDDGAKIALETEWNNKDTFFDRDLDNFQRLHAYDEISVGIVVTRGVSLQDGLRAMVSRFARDRGITNAEGLEEWGCLPTRRQLKEISRRIDGSSRTPAKPFADAFADMFVSDKFGSATTHWRKLEDRIRRGVGNPCPLILIGLPASIVTFDEGKSALAEVLEANAVDDLNEAA